MEQKELRERVKKVWKLFSQKGTWQHPISGQTFDREATIVLFELIDDETLRSRWIFELTRYVVKFALQTAQAILFFVAPNSRTFVVTSYTEAVESAERIQVRRLIVDLDNIARTDVEVLTSLRYDAIQSTRLVEGFSNALPYLKVGREFFHEYHDLFQLLSKRLAKVLGSTEKSYGYAQRLLGRITFLYFLQRKGWLDGDRAYLRKSWAKFAGNELFEFLHKLFDALNTEENIDPTTGRIPYLNGSLFEPDSFSPTKRREIRAACAPILGQILEVFNQYNFTISESTPLDKEVAVDPELLGSLFESMLPESERGDKGTFYTHQEEMVLMAREALRNHLARFPQLLGPDQVLFVVYGLDSPSRVRIEPRMAREVKDILGRVKILDPAVGSGGFLMAALQVLQELRGRLNNIIGTVEPPYDMKLNIIENTLFGVDIEFEAIELARLRLWLSLVVDEAMENVRPLPNLDFNLHQGDSLRIPEFEDKVRQSRLTIDHAIRSALLKKIAITREEYARSHGREKEARRVELTSTLRKLLELETGAKPPTVLPFSYRYFFADVIAEGGFDIVLMNPPYVQQEDIGKLPGQRLRSYKSEIAEDMVSLTTGKFSPNKQSDISVYFHVRSLFLLKEQGVAMVIATNKWLDARYGIPLQEYLLRNATIECIYDSAYRSFSSDVNTVITVIRKVSGGSESNMVRFVNFKIPLKQVSAPMVYAVLGEREEGLFFRELYRVTVRSQMHLYEDGLVEIEEKSKATKPKSAVNPRSINRTTPKVYVGTKWGNLHLRAPSVYYQVIQKFGRQPKQLGKAYPIMRGATTGAVDFFILEETGRNQPKGLVKCRNGFGRDFWLEEKFCPHVLADPEDIEGYTIGRRILKTRIFRCNLERPKLSGTKALEYILWAEGSEDAKVKIIRGENRGKLVRIPELPTVQSRSEWYQLPSIEAPRVMLPNIVKNRHVIPLCLDEVYSDDTFIGLYIDGDQDAKDLWLYLNSAVFRLFMELNGRSEGAGALHMMVYEYKQCPLIGPLPSLSKKFRGLDSFKSRPAYRIVNVAEEAPLEFAQKDRVELDNLVLEEMGFSEGTEREKVLSEIYRWLEERVRERLTKPKTAPESVAKGIGRPSPEADLREFS